MATTPEGKIKDRVKKWWKGLDKAYYFMPSQNGRGVNGVADFIGVVNGVFVAIETKAPGGTLTPLQAMFLESVRTAGGVAAVVYNDADLTIVQREIASVIADERRPVMFTLPPLAPGGWPFDAKLRGKK